jgi:3-deoxy-D-manno-octulosonic-acid transferase
MNLVYQILIRLYKILILVVSPFSKKAKQWVQGRKNLIARLPSGLNKDIIWFHCASLGEYEQAKPLINSIKSTSKKYNILLTFFSPSGYLNAGKNKNVDFKSYIPLDTLSNANKFIERVNPKCAIFIKSELWPNFFDILNKKFVPIFVVSAIFKAENYLFKPYGKWQLKILRGVTHFFVQDKNSKTLLQNNGITQVSVSGDNRYDKVIENSLNPQEIPLITSFKGSKSLVVAGSTYKIDSEMLINISKKMQDVKFIIAPHNIDYANELQNEGLLYSQANEKNIKDHSILIIDNIGILSQLYQYASVSYVGGAFGNGLHNILEALAFGSIVIFGPKYHKYKEAKDAIENGIARSVSKEQELEKSIEHFINNKTDKKEVLAFCEKRNGANELIIKRLKASI